MSPRDWTAGPAKWAAVLVLGSASLAGMTWSILRPHRQVTLDVRAPRALATEAAAAESPEPAPAPAPVRTININTASAAELELLPGIGPALAGRIVEFRKASGPFTSIDQLDQVKGIGPRTLERLRPLVRIDDAATMP